MQTRATSLLPTRSGPSAFTLIELLVVIGVIAILVALLFPAIALSKARAERALCASNLRQVSAAIHLYADADPQERLPYTNHLSVLYTRLIQPYLSGVQSNRVIPIPDRVFACPADRFYREVPNFVDGSHFRKFGTSYLFNGRHWLTNPEPAWTGGAMGGFGLDGVALSTIPRPERTVLIYEVPATGGYSWHRPRGHTQFNDAWNNLAFVDTHVEYMKIYWTNDTWGSNGQMNPKPIPPGYEYQWNP